MMFVAGQSTDASAGTGGAVSLSTGIGAPSSSGRVLIQSVNSGTSGVSDGISLSYLEQRALVHLAKLDSRLEMPQEVRQEISWLQWVLGY